MYRRQKQSMRRCLSSFCIYLETDDVDRKLYIHPDECIDCGACELSARASAIFEQSAVPSE